MSIFPAIVPSSRTLTPPTKPGSSYAATTGRGVRIRHGNIEVGQGLVVTFENVTEAEMLTLRAHYLAHHQLRIPFNLSAEAKVGETAGVLDAAGYAWIYAGPIDEHDTQCDVHSVTVALERVPEMALSGWLIQGLPAAFVTTGRRAELRYSSRLSGAAASFAATGQAAQLLHHKAIVGQAAAFATTTHPAELIKTATYPLAGLAASFVTTGQDAVLMFDGDTWTPTELNPTAWYDAGTPGDFTLDSGTVTQWNDRSGNALHLTESTAAFKPAYASATQNSLNLVTFDGTNDRLTGAAMSNYITASAFTVLAVVRTRNVSAGETDTWNNRAIMADDNGTWGIHTRALADPVTDISIVGYNWDGDDDSAGQIVGANNVWSIIVYTHGSGNINMHRNGSTAVTAASGDTAYLGALLTLGSAPIVSLFQEMDLAEVVFLDTTANTTDRQLLEGYAAHRWGLTSLLPSDHPYKSTAP